MTEYLGGTTVSISSTPRGNGESWYTVVLTTRMGYPLAMVHSSHKPKVKRYESFVSVDMLVDNYAALYADDVVWEGDDSEEETEEEP